MDEYIAFDCHKHYTLAEREEVAPGRVRQCRIEHRPGAIRSYLATCAPGTVVALEATGNWYWIVDEIEEARCVPALVHARKGKLMMGLINKTDPLDVHGLNRLQRAGTLPTVWVPPAELRDLRELARTRMVNARQRTRLKNRVTATLAKYGLRVQGASDAFGVKGREQMKALIQRLPPETLWNLRLLLKQLDLVERQIDGQERRMKALVKRTPEMERLMTLPGVAFILATVIALEVGVIERFADAEHLASYSGTTPRVHSSGGKTRYGPLRQDVNQYLKWAFAEAANAVAVHHLQWPDRHVSRLYRRLRKRKGHAKAVGAVARHVAEATWHVWSRGEDYRDPVLGRIRKG